MRPILTAALALAWPVLLMLAGCGGGATGGAGTSPAASHGGTLLDLPGNAGLVELMIERADPQAGGRRAQGKVVALFTNQAGNAALDPAPTDVVFIDEDGKRHPLSSSMTGDAAAARFESQPIPAAPGEPTGTLEVKLGGQVLRVQSRSR